MRGHGCGIIQRAGGQEEGKGRGKPPPWGVGGSEERKRRRKEERKEIRKIKRYEERERLYTP